ncbi:hypothetical protein NKH12_03755 [Mesorhizobium sp. M1322]
MSLAISPAYRQTLEKCSTHQRLDKHLSSYISRTTPSAKPPDEKRASHVFHAIDCPEIKARYRDFHLISIVVRNAGIDVPDAQALNDTIAAAEQAALRDDAQRDAHLAAWAVAYEAFGTKANRTPCSAAALLKRVRKDGSLRGFPHWLMPTMPSACCMAFRLAGKISISTRGPETFNCEGSGAIRHDRAR